MLMADVEFEPQNYSQFYTPDAPTGLTGLVIRMGMAKDADQANKIFVAVGIICLSVMVFFVHKLFAGPKNLPPPHNTPPPGFEQTA